MCDLICDSVFWEKLSLTLETKADISGSTFTLSLSLESIDLLTFSHNAIAKRDSIHSQIVILLQSLALQRTTLETQD